MTKGERLRLAGQFDEALPQLRRQASRERADDAWYRMRAATSVGICLLHLKRYAEAVEHFLDLADQVKFRNVHHFIYAGWAMWLQGDRAAAVAVWERGRRAGAQKYYGLATEFVLYYAFSRSQGEYDPAVIEKKMRKMIQKKDESLDHVLLSRYLLGEIDDYQLFRYARDVQNSIRGQAAVDELSTMLEFYRGARAMHVGQTEQGWAHIRKCAAAEHVTERYFEVIMAQTDVRATEAEPQA